MKISISQIKTANASLAKRAWQYILGVKDERESDSLPLGNLFENYLINKVDAYDEYLQNVIDREKVIATYDALKHNAVWLEIPEWYYQYKIEGTLFDLPYIWYADIYREDCIYDIKTIGKTGDIDATHNNMWSNMTYLDEYKLQMRAYMKATGVKKTKILAVWKFLYKDERHDNRIVDIDWSDELDQEMTAKFWPLVEKMKSLYKQY